MLARSARAKARCSACRPLRTPVGRRRGGVGEPGGVRGEGAVGQPGVGHRFERERPDAVEQPVADGVRRSSSSTMTSERLASRPTTSIAAAAGTSSASSTNSTAGERCATGERGQRPEAPLVVGEQQLVAPPDRRLQRPAALRSAAGRVAQHVEAVVEAAGDLLDRQRLGAGRGELDRQRQTVERAAQVRAPRRRARADRCVAALRAWPAG